MDKKPSDSHSSADAGADSLKQERAVDSVPQSAKSSTRQEEISLLELWRVVWRQRFFVALVTAIFLAVSAAYVLLAAPWYRADVLLAPADEKSTQSIPGQLGSLVGLAGLAGISVGGGGNVEPIAVLRSRDFARAFIQDYDLLPVFFADDWDSDRETWSAGDQSDWPDIRDAIVYFDENIRRISEDPATSLVTFSIEWTDPDIAAEWANLLIKRLNSNMRQRALTEAEANVQYLQGELGATSVVSLRQAISGLLEAELQKLMLAKGSEEFAFRIIDRAQAPKKSERPRHFIIMAIAVILGGMIAVFIVLVRHMVAQALAAETRERLDGV